MISWALVLINLAIVIRVASAYGGEAKRCVAQKLLQDIGLVSQFGNLVAPHNQNNAELAAELKKVFTRVKSSHFEVGRGIADYFDYLRDGSQKENLAVLSFAKSLLKLGPHSHVMDIGAGMLKPLIDLSGDFTEMGHSLSEYWKNPEILNAAKHLLKNGAPNMTGVTMVDFNQNEFSYVENGRISKQEITSNPKIHSILGRYFEDVPNSELTQKFGKVDLVVDLSGVLAYSLNHSLVIEKLAAIMKPGAELWMRANLVKVETPYGTVLPIDEYIGTLPGFKLNLSAKDAKGFGALLTRTIEPFKRTNLELISVSDNQPPPTFYRVIPESDEHLSADEKLKFEQKALHSLGTIEQLQQLRLNLQSPEAILKYERRINLLKNALTIEAPRYLTQLIVDWTRLGKTGTARELFLANKNLVKNDQEFGLGIEALIDLSEGKLTSPALDLLKQKIKKSEKAITPLGNYPGTLREQAILEGNAYGFNLLSVLKSARSSGRYARELTDERWGNDANEKWMKTVAKYKDKFPNLVKATLAPTPLELGDANQMADSLYEAWSKVPQAKAWLEAL